MPRRRRSSHTCGGNAKSTRRRRNEDASLDGLLHAGDWKAFLDVALRTEDPKYWPDVHRIYREQPDLRSLILFFIPLYWREHPELVAPLLREALHDHKRCANALHAATLFPALTEEVVACLQNPQLVEWAGPDAFVATLACFFGLLEAPPDELLRFAWGGLDPILQGVRAELEQRYGLDLDVLVT